MITWLWIFFAAIILVANGSENQDTDQCGKEEKSSTPPTTTTIDATTTEHHETDPCDEEEEPSTPPTTVPTTPSTSQKATTQSTSTTRTSTTTQTTPTSTTTLAVCPTDDNRYTPIIRKNGYWCAFSRTRACPQTNLKSLERNSDLKWAKLSPKHSRVTFNQPTSRDVVPLPYSEGVEQCSLLGAEMASLETEAESILWANLVRRLSLASYPISGFWVKSDYNATSERWYWSDGQADPNIDPQPTVRDPNGKIAAFVGSDPDTPATLEVVSQRGTGPGVVNTVLCGVPGLQFS
ncbi:Protein CBG11289 [Caenorhabditis briggsae]|uniref:Protein CBG11289 n=1 Tax=Caenorhabditis briggsae TaxID=6238 RepID=A8XDD1_CAEBR|nr:Protein CBG11289 [Caenorhabditis briggsae]CAP30650.1 Protein CBG11289 [Caenorhabditis briggsae]